MKHDNTPPLFKCQFYRPAGKLYLMTTLQAHLNEISTMLADLDTKNQIQITINRDRFRVDMLNKDDYPTIMCNDSTMDIPTQIAYYLRKTKDDMSIVPNEDIHQLVDIVDEDAWQVKRRAELTQELMNLANKEVADRARIMPTEKDALMGMLYGYMRLQELGFKSIIYCPKDGTVFDAVEAGSTGIFPCYYEGEWPKGSWWAIEADDLWPSYPILFKLRNEDKTMDENTKETPLNEPVEAVAEKSFPPALIKREPPRTHREQEAINNMAEWLLVVHHYCNKVKPCREASVAKTHIENAMLWFKAAIDGQSDAIIDD